jgi:predicted N-acetyltransferase YhbS
VGFSKLRPDAVRFPGPVDPKRLLGLALAEGALDALSGAVCRAGIDHAVCADGAPLR